MELLILFSVYLYLCLIATYHVTHVDYLEKQQIFYQLLFAWLIPIIGAITVSVIHLNDSDYVFEQKHQQGFGKSVINICVLTAFWRAGSSGNVGAVDSSGDNYSGFDSGGSDVGGGGDA